jgi:FAD/FMN-containing dehydrogenase
MNELKPTWLERLTQIVGARGLLTEESDTAAHYQDWRGRYCGQGRCVVKPADTGEVSKVVALCAELGVAVVPQGGNTGLCGGAVPTAATELVLNLSRLNRIRALDLENDTVTVEAGCVLANLQQAAREAQRLFPLSLAAEGSCQIGGNLSTNAGGVAVLRYGNMRDLVLGLEVVLPDGRVWNGLRGLRKDNTGYDLKQLFIGAEGTLGIITAAVLKLFPLPQRRATALVAVGSPGAAVELLGRMRADCGDRLTAFELIERACLDLVIRHIPNMVDPLPQRYPWQVLVELSDTLPSGDLGTVLESSLGGALERGLALDAAVATSEAQITALWALRENISEAQRHEGPGLKHDVSVPVSRIAAFIENAGDRLRREFPGVRVIAFGHIGDGNIHYNMMKALGAKDAELTASGEAIGRLVHDLVHDLGGSISAEHGLGQLKRDEIRRYKSPLELELMQKLKAALDPHGLMNPGKGGA